MDLVRELKDVRFELSLRGYDCEAVDAFLARLRGDITTLQEANESSAARISELEAAQQDGGASSETEGTLRRTLVLAQRLADETEAEAKKAASEMIAAATAEAEQMRASAEIEARSMRDEGQRELSNARDEAASIRETSGEEAAMIRAESRSSSEQILAEAERRGMERVAVLEQAAQVEARTMRESIRSEVRELEAARARVMADIAGLEAHLEQQRVRVRTAVEALRVGMSGSIEDLERVAEDDDLLASQPAPQISGASAADIAVAPDIEIVESVAAQAPPAPTVEDIEDAVAAASDEIAEVDGSADPASPIDEVVVEDDAVVVEDDALVVEDDDVLDAEVVLEEASPATEQIPLVDADVPDLEAIDVDTGEPATGFDEAGFDDAPVVEEAAADWQDNPDAELIELDNEPTALFGTDLAVDAEATDVLPTGDQLSSEEAAAESGTGPEQQTSFVDRFSELLDSLPVGGDE